MTWNSFSNWCQIHCFRSTYSRYIIFWVPLNSEKMFSEVCLRNQPPLVYSVKLYLLNLNWILGWICNVAKREKYVEELELTRRGEEQKRLRAEDKERKKMLTLKPRNELNDSWLLNQSLYLRLCCHTNSLSLKSFQHHQKLKRTSSVS